MNIDDVESFLRSAREALPGIATEMGRKRTAAYLKLFDESEPGRWAVVWTPGDGWVSLDLDGGFSLDHYEEEIEDDDLKAVISGYIEVAVAYLNATSRENLPIGRRFPVLTVTTPDGTIELRRSLVQNLQEMFKFGR